MTQPIFITILVKFERSQYMLQITDFHFLKMLLVTVRIVLSYPHEINVYIESDLHCNVYYCLSTFILLKLLDVQEFMKELGFTSINDIPTDKFLDAFLCPIVKNSLKPQMILVKFYFVCVSKCIAKITSTKLYVGGVSHPVFFSLCAWEKTNFKV